MPGAVGAVLRHHFPAAFIPEVMQTNAAPVTPREPKFRTSKKQTNKKQVRQQACKTQK